MIDKFGIAICLCGLCMLFVAISRLKRAQSHVDESIELLEHARTVAKRISEAETFYIKTFCACESCKNRECPHKLTRFVIADAVRMCVPVRVDNLMGDCSGYTEEEEL